MKKLSIGLLAAGVIALAAAPAEAAKKGKSKKGGKAEVAQVHPMGFTCTLNYWFSAKQPKACGGK